MSNVFEQITDKVRSSYFIIWVWLVALVGVVLGFIFFYQDTISSRWGFEMLEKAFGLNLAAAPVVYLAMSLAPQVGQILFGYAFLDDTENRTWALLVAVVFFAIDIVSDVWYITNGSYTDAARVLVASTLSLLFFTVGCEMFIAFGFGLCLETFAPAINQMRRAFADISKALAGPRRPSQSQRPPHDPPQQGRHQQAAAPVFRQEGR